MQSDDHSNRLPSSPVGRKLWGRLLVVVLILLTIGFGVRTYLLQLSETPNVTPPGPRKGLPAPFITSDQAIVNKMVELARLTENDLVYDLGCGDGRIVITAARLSGCRGIGFDIDPKRIAESRENARIQDVEDRVTFREQDVFTVDLSEADVAMAYLLPWMIEKMRPQFEQMKPGARIVLHDFWIEGVEPDQYVEMDLTPHGDTDHGIYVYVLPLKLNPNLERLKPPRPRGWQPTGAETHEAGRGSQ